MARHKNDPYNVLDLRNVSRNDTPKHTGRTASSSEYYALDFKAEMARQGQENYYAAMKHQFNTEVQTGEDDKEISFDADDNPYHILKATYHILDSRDPNEEPAEMQTEQESLSRAHKPSTPKIIKDESPDADINAYHIVEPLEADNVSDAKCVHEEMLEVTNETTADEDDYN